MKPRNSIALFVLAIAPLIGLNCAWADDDGLNNKFFVETNLPTHSDGIQRFEPANFLPVKKLSAYELIENIVNINKIDAEFALVLWNGDFFKNGEELNDKILKGTSASEIKFIEIFDGEGGDDIEKPNKIINLITKVYKVEPDPVFSNINIASNKTQLKQPQFPINGSLEFDTQKSTSKPQFATVFDEQGRLENAKVNFGETETKSLSTSFTSAQEVFGNEFFLEAKFKKKQSAETKRKANLIGVSDTEIGSTESDNEEVLALNSVMKSRILGFDAVAKISSTTSLKSENNDQLFFNEQKQGQLETLGALIELENDNIVLSAGAETKSLIENQTQGSSQFEKIKLVQSKAFAKIVHDWKLLNKLEIISEIGGDLFTFDAPHSDQHPDEVFALSSKLIASVGNPKSGFIRTKFELIPSEYYRNNVGFIFPFESDMVTDFSVQNNRNIEVFYEKQFGANGDLKLGFESSKMQNQLRTITLYNSDGYLNEVFGNFGDSRYQKIAANYEFELPFLTKAKLNSAVKIEKEQSPNAKIGDVTFSGETKKKNYQIDFSSSLGIDNHTWGATYELSDWRQLNSHDGSSNSSQNGRLGVFVNFDYGISGIIRAEINSDLNGPASNRFYDKNGTAYSPLDFTNSDKPKLRLIYMKKI